MPLTVAVQMDPIEHIKIAGDTTFALLLEAQRRGHALVYWTPDRLSMRDGRVVFDFINLYDAEDDIVLHTADAMFLEPGFFDRAKLPTCN